MLLRLLNSRSLVRAAAATVALSVWFIAPGASAQSLPDSIVRSLQLSDADGSQITAFVEQNSTKLGSKDPEAIRKDRSALLQPLADDQISTAFRQQYGRALISKLEPLAADADELTAINALVIAGDLGTDGAADLVLSKVGSSNASIRYQSAYAIQRLFGTLGNAGRTMKSNKSQALIAAVEAALQKETDSLVVDGLVRAGLAGARVEEIRSNAVLAVANGVSRVLVGQKQGAVADQLAASVLRAGSGLTEVLANPASSVRADATKAAAGLGGDMIAYVSRTVAGKSLPLKVADATTRPGVLTTRELHAQVALSGETLVLLSGKTLNAGFDAPNRKSGERLRAGTNSGDAEFLVEVVTVIGNSGILVNDPFDLPAARFVVK